jgi:hypothetical protein
MVTGEINFRNGYARQFWGREVISSGTVSQSKFEGFNTDTTNNVTGIVFDWDAITVTGFIEIWGWP